MAKAQSRRATPSAANRGVQAQPGDATGKENERLRKENADAIRAAATQTTLVNPPPVVEQTDQVVDYTDGGDPNTGTPQEARLITMEEATADGSPVVSSLDIPEGEIDIDSLPDGKTDVLPEILANEQEPQPAHGERRDSQQEVRRQETPEAPPQRSRGPQRQQAPKVEQAHRILRVNTDLEDITIGKDNHFTFRVGVPYKVQAHVYDHLDEKGYVLR